MDNKDNSFSASYISNHFKLSILNNENKNKIPSNNDLLEFDKSEIKESLLQDKTIENSICK